MSYSEYSESREDNDLRGFKFGADNGMWLTSSRKKKKFVANWSVGRTPSSKANDLDVSGFITISGKKGKVRIHHDVDDNMKLTKKDELIGSARGGKNFGYSNDFGEVAFKADALSKSKNGEQDVQFNYYFNLIPSDADSDVPSLKIPVSSDWISDQGFVGAENMTVSDFETMVKDVF